LLTPEPFSYAAWFRALKAGRSFATNGPLLFLTVAGLEPGDTVRARPGEKLRVRVEAKSLRPLDCLEVIYRGRVIRSFKHPNRRGDLVGVFAFAPPTDGWLAARVFEKPSRTIRFSHTSPVYFDLATPTTAAEDAKFFLDWIDREMHFYQASAGFRREEDRVLMIDLFAKVRAIYERMVQ
jgi:TolB protein